MEPTTATFSLHFNCLNLCWNRSKFVFGCKMEAKTGKKKTNSPEAYFKPNFSNSNSFFMSDMTKIFLLERDSSMKGICAEADGLKMIHSIWFGDRTCRVMKERSFSEMKEVAMMEMVLVSSKLQLSWNASLLACFRVRGIRSRREMERMIKSMPETMANTMQYFLSLDIR